jgi:hypothetical protein
VNGVMEKKEEDIIIVGWIGFGLNVINKYDNRNNDWLSKDGNKNEWVVAYHGLRNGKAIKSIILEGFKRYLEIYRAVIELNEKFDFSQSIYKEINEIINESKFIFNKNNDELNVINRDKEDIEYKIITFDKIRELKNKIQLKQEGKKDSLHDTNSNNYIKRYEKLKFFKDLTVNIEEIKELMTVLRTKGSTLYISICVNISYPDVNYILDGKKRDFKDIHDFLSKAKTNIINKLDSIYKDMTTIRFLYGKQIDCIKSY